MTATTSKLGADMTDEEIAHLALQHYAMYDHWQIDLVAFARALLARQPAAIDKEPVAEVVMEPFDTWPRLKWISVESMRNVEAGDMLYAAPLAQTALADDAHDAIRRAALEESIQIIETHRVPVGNSPAGEMAAGWTMDALHEIRDAIRELTAAQSASGDDHAN